VTRNPPLHTEKERFTDLGVERITANTMTVNTRSRRVMDKAGLSFLRHFSGDWPETIEGSEHGEVEYALTKPEWEAHVAGG
jgi:RimJ/RimL family protein N-acetyltransferase